MSNSTLTMIRTQSYIQLDDLPYELQYEIVKLASNDGWGKETLRDVACVNSYYNEIAKRLINEYEFDHLHDFHGYGFQNFIKIMTSDTDRAAGMRRLALTANWYDYAYHFDEFDHRAGVSAADFFGIWSMQEMINLKELLVAYPRELIFLGCGLPPNLQALTVRPEGLPGFRYKRESQNPVELAGSVHGFFLATALSSKSLKKLDLGGQEVVNEDIISMTESPVNRESPIEHLKLTVGTFGEKALINLLRAPRGLRTFEFTPPTFEDVNYHSTNSRWSSIFDPEKLPRPSILGAALAAQAATLESLTIRRGDTRWSPHLDQIGSLTKFRALKHLDIDCTMLLGWDHCEHVGPFGENKAMFPSAITELLSTSIETLTLRFEDYHNRHRNGLTYILQILSSLEKASQSSLSKLCTVTFNMRDTLPYCRWCEEETETTVDGTLSWRSSVSNEQARDVCKFARDASFEFKLVASGFTEGLNKEFGWYDTSGEWSVSAQASEGEDVSEVNEPRENM